MAKRALDVVLSGLLLVTLSPLIVLSSVVVIGFTGWPPFYGARRMGRGGRVFRMWKLRTMRRNADREGAITRANDERITTVGAALRRRHLDELPQLWNVLVGDMSLVGPRPEDPDIAERAGFREAGILLVRPGITGPAQLNFTDETRLLGAGRNAEDDYLIKVLPDKMWLDLEYVDHRSFWLDLKILLRTVGLIVRRPALPE